MQHQTVSHKFQLKQENFPLSSASFLLFSCYCFSSKYILNTNTDYFSPAVFVIHQRPWVRQQSPQSNLQTYRVLPASAEYSFTSSINTTPLAYCYSISRFFSRLKRRRAELQMSTHVARAWNHGTQKCKCMRALWIHWPRKATRVQF